MMTIEWYGSNVTKLRNVNDGEWMGNIYMCMYAIGEQEYVYMCTWGNLGNKTFNRYVTVTGSRIATNPFM